MTTEQFTATFGINPGYGHNNTLQGDLALTLVAKAWAEAAEKVFERTNIYVAAVLNRSRTVYRQEWGCPEGGEETVTAAGVRNPEFTPNTEAWVQAVDDVCVAIGRKLEQSRVSLVFSEARLTYLKLADKP